jgi:hypothetical protein
MLRVVRRNSLLPSRSSSRPTPPAHGGRGEAQRTGSSGKALQLGGLAKDGDGAELGLDGVHGSLSINYMKYQLKQIKRYL